MSKVMIYGANGYTAGLIIEKLLLAGIKPLLAGRNAAKVNKVAKVYNLPHAVFALDDSQYDFSGIEVFFNAAGPYSLTAKPALKLCLAYKMHYLDITGEVATFEYIAAQSEKLRAAGVVAIPGVGFDVVPSDLMAAYLHAQLPDANALDLAFRATGKISRGTLKTVIENLGHDSVARRDGKIVSVKSLALTREIVFGKRAVPCMSIPWGDVSTAYHSTGIPNIVVYSPMPVSRQMLKIYEMSAPLLRKKWMHKLLQKVADSMVYGPDAEQRDTGKVQLWGEVRNSSGTKKTAQMITKDGYEFTAEASCFAVQELLHKKREGGFYTPSLAFGLDNLQKQLGLQPQLLH